MERTFSLPAFLSFIIPGVGQLIKKQFIKTVIIWIAAFIIMIVLFSISQGLFFMGCELPILPFVVVAFLFWVWNIYDAYNRQNDWRLK